MTAALSPQITFHEYIFFSILFAVRSALVIMYKYQNKWENRLHTDVMVSREFDDRNAMKTKCAA